MIELIPLLFFAAICGALMLGYPVALTLTGVSLGFAGLGMALGVFDGIYLNLIPSRLYGILTNQNLLAVPLFVFMGTMLEKSRVADDLLQNMAIVFARLPGGLGLSVVLVGMLLAASTGIVGATVVTMGILSLPTMLKAGYKPSLAAGTLCATGTLGQIIPPSICLVLLGEVISNAYQQSQLNSGVFAPDFVSIGDLFAGAIVPGLLLVTSYLAYVLITAIVRPQDAPPLSEKDIAALRRDNQSLAVALIKGLLPPVFLMVAVLGSILMGIATPTEAASVGALGALALALSEAGAELDSTARGEPRDPPRDLDGLSYSGRCGDIFVGVPRLWWRCANRRGLAGASGRGVLGDARGNAANLFAWLYPRLYRNHLYGRALGGSDTAEHGPRPIWLGIMIAVNLQTSFLTPPFGFSLFYLRSVAPPEVRTQDIYRGVIPFVLLQLALLLLLALQPGIVTWLPNLLKS